MPTASWEGKLSIGGVTTSEQINVTAPNQKLTKLQINPAFACVLSTRTDNATGIVTLATGHGITTANKIMFAWLVAGVWTYRYGSAVTAAGSTTVSFNAGAGTNLPIATTAGIISIQNREEMIINQLPSTYKALNFQVSDQTLVILGLDVTGLGTPTYYPYVVTPTAPLQFIAGMVRSDAPITGSAGLITRTESAGDQMRSVDFYNLVTSKVNASGIVLHN